MWHWTGTYLTKEGQVRTVKVTAADEDSARIKMLFLTKIGEKQQSFKQGDRVQEDAWKNKRK